MLGQIAQSEPNLKTEGITKIHNEHVLHTVTLFFCPLKRSKTLFSFLALQSQYITFTLKFNLESGGQRILLFVVFQML